MPLLRNFGQPYFPDQNSPANLDCVGEYCYPLVTGDTVKAQFYQTPCGVNLISDPTFTDITLGSELVVNPFSADPLSSWNYDPVNLWWELNINNFTNELYSSVAITAGELYRLEFTLSGITLGNYLDIYLGSTAITTTVNANGNITLDLIAGSDDTELKFVAVSVNYVYLSNISLKAFTLNDWDTNGGWQIDDNLATHISGTGSLIQTVANYITSGDYYSFTYTVSGRTTGTVTPRLANTSGAAQSGNGTFTIYITAGSDGVASFVPSSNFDGSVSFGDVRLLKNDFVFEAITDKGDGDTYDISAYLSYYQDKITLDFDPDEESGFPYGCFIIRAYDECEIQYGDFAVNGNFAGGLGNSCPNWQKNNDGTMYDFNSSTYKSIRSGAGQTNFPILKNVQNTNLLAGNYELTFTIVSNTDPVGIAVTMGLDGAYFGTYYGAVGTHTVTINNYDPNNSQVSPANRQRILIVSRFNNDGSPHLGEVEIDNVQVYRIEPYDSTHTSECINYGATIGDTKLITAYCDTNQMGFEFENTGFVLQQRMMVRSLNPTYAKTRLIQESGSGNSQLNYVQSTKTWEFVTDFISESAHDGLSTQIDCDHFLIGSNEDNQKEYIATISDYTPEWRPNGDYVLAPVTINLKIKEGNTKFNRKCVTE